MERVSPDSHPEEDAVVRGIFEVVQALMLCGRPLSHVPVTSEHSIKVYISCAKDVYDNGHQPFKVKILSDRGLDAALGLKEGWFGRLMKVTGGELCDGCLLVTRQVQEEHWVQDQYNLNTTTCYLQSCENMSGKKMAPFKIQFQVLDFQENIVKTYQKLQCLFRAIKLFQPVLHLTLHLRICGLECKEEFSSDMDYLLDDMTRPPIIISPDYYSRNILMCIMTMQQVTAIRKFASRNVEGNTDLQCSAVHVKTGEMIPLPKPDDCDTLHPLAIKALAILVPFTNPSCTENHGFINILCGFESQLFFLEKMKDGDLMCDSYESCPCNTCVNPDPFGCPIQIHTKHISSSADKLKDQKSYVIYIYLAVQAHLQTAQSCVSAAPLGLFQMSQDHFTQWYPRWKDRIQLAINSALCSIWCKDYVCIPSEVNHPHEIDGPDVEGETVHTDPVPLATDSLVSFLSSTTSDDFKRSCLQALQVTTLSAAKTVLRRKLSRIALHNPMEHNDTQEEEPCYSQGLDEALEDLDKWIEEE